jgi:iron complex outermembrane receptor protein
MPRAETSMEPNTHPLSALSVAVAMMLGSLFAGGAAQAQGAPAQPQAGASSVSAPGTAQAQSFDIPAQPAAQALQRFVEVTKFQLVYSPDVVQGVSTHAILGVMTPREALQRMFEGTRLSVVSTGVNAATIRPIVPAQSDDGVTALEKVVVVATALPDSTRTGTRTDTDPMNLPQSITVVPKSLMNDQQARSVADVLANVPGVVNVPLPSGASGSFQMRGFSVGLMFDGSLISTGLKNAAADLTPPLIAIDRVEVVKGPEAVIAGIASSYGGVVNLITKAPSTRLQVEAIAELGSNSTRSIGVSHIGPLSDDKRWTDSLVAYSSGTGRNEVGFDGRYQTYLAPTLAWKDRQLGTEFSFGYEYNSIHEGFIPYGFTTAAVIPDGVQTVRLDSLNQYANTVENRAFLGVKQRFGDGWEISGKLINLRVHNDQFGDIVAGFAYPKVSTFAIQYQQDATSRIAKLDLTKEFELGSVTNKLLIAADYDDTVLSQNQYYGATRSVNLTTPIDTVTPVAFPTIPTFLTPYSSTEYGLLVMDQIFWGNWVATLGYRWIGFEAKSSGVASDDAHRGLPSIGIVYKMSPELSLYANANEGFQSSTGRTDPAGNLFEPQNSKQAEFGVKVLMMDKRLALTADIYQIKQHNVPVINPAQNLLPDGRPWYILIDGVTSQGAELELSGEITPRWGIRASYAYQKVTNLDGTPTIGVPSIRSTEHIWSKFRLTSDSTTQYWWIAGGISDRGDATKRGLTAATPVTIPGRLRLDISAGYTSPTWSVTAGIKNATDASLYSAQSSFALYYEQKREVNITAMYRF